MKKINNFISQEAFQLYKISSVTYLFCYLYKFIQLKRSLQNDITFPHLILKGNVSPITLIKLFLFLTLLVAFYSSLKHA